MNIDVWLLMPLVVTVIWARFAFQPFESSGGDYGHFGDALDVLLRVAALVPVLFVWLVYFILN